MSKSTGAAISGKSGAWFSILGGTATLALVVNQVWLSLDAGVWQFSSPKYGFLFLGVEAVVIHAALTLGAALVIGIGWRGLRQARVGI
ncbi:MAG: hypothetical protein C0521_00885 [Xanthomonas sp.]|nr:hypothetical protein [Xanthomonas sp.]